MRRTIAVLALALPLACNAATIYLCKAYNGGTFWAQDQCSAHQALIDSIVSVPDGMSFEQQVHVAEQQRGGGGGRIMPSTVNGGVNQQAITQAECKSLDARITQLDAQARQPQSGAGQDRIRSDRNAARDRQFSLHCQ